MTLHAQSAALPSQTQVLVVGAGPVGLALALDLTRRGIACVLIDKSDGIIRYSKMGAVAVRSMEYCRQWGIADQVRNCGFPADFELGQVFCTSLTGHLIGKSAPTSDGPEAALASPELKTRCPQLWFDPILQNAVRSLQRTTLQYDCELLSFTETASGVRATVRTGTSSQPQIIEAQYMVGCDGAGSHVRRLLGVQMKGEDVLNYSVGVYFRSSELLKLHDKGPAERYIFVGEDGNWAHLTVVDGRELWRLTVMGGDNRIDMETFDSQAWVDRCIGKTGAPYEITAVLPWRRSKVVAERFRVGRTFLCGDAVHVMSPNGGFGMNTGIGDAADLGWKLQAVLEGWASPSLLDSYEAERKPIGLRNTFAAAGNYAKIATAIDWSLIDSDTEAGARKRASVGSILVEAARGNLDSLGISIGYRYENSPICVSDGTPPPPDDPYDYVPTSRPGHRAPHAWIGKDRSTLDLFGDGFVALRFGQDAPDLTSLAQAAASRGVPLRIHMIDDPDVARLYEKRLVLVRPDGHVAWRGDQAPADPARVIDIVRGASHVMNAQDHSANAG
ncbi:FAD-dependent monooxygenase [Roseiarcaceae bacterium H3SJ34-1]|uniref:FAD-dependent monooxygenase n=1 Tax=Terripilifer ovatus TaxID=3032367 RepID=UPI003AB98D2D|nr:FAD-dependent monooxygenase [Roseiarcaceae bacterium H3SJ34-1]